jgi:glycosyltransferase involved in cell wall biosynthesis
MDLSILIPSRNEMFLAQTVKDILENMEGDTEIIVVCDGAWSDPPIVDHPRLTIIYHSESIGQRAATNEAARLSNAKFIMKADAHCAFDKGFDVKLMKEFEYDWTVIPRMFNLHAFDWACQTCGHRVYQGPYPTSCEKCDNTTAFERVIVWKPRRNCRADFMRFDSDLHFKYWREFERRPEAKGDFGETMSLLGACWMLHRQRYWDIDGLDESHGSWGQMGTELACKTWLSGGRLLVNKRTWFSHLFRTQPGFGFPYPNPGVKAARERSKELWFNNAWPKAKYPLSWMLRKFYPIPEWTDEAITNTERNNPGFIQTADPVVPVVATELSKGCVYYTDNRLDPIIQAAVQNHLEACCHGYDIVSVSLAPLEFARNFVINAERGHLTMFQQILKGLEECQADIVYLTEHDILYHPSHFDFIPPRDDIFYYNENTWKVDVETGQSVFYYTKQASGCCAYRKLLVEHYRKRVERVQNEGFTRRMGFEPGCHQFPRGVDDRRAERWMSEIPNLDLRHKHNLTQSRWRQDQFRSQRACRGWTLADEVPGWGMMKGRIPELLSSFANIHQENLV